MLLGVSIICIPWLPKLSGFIINEHLPFARANQSYQSIFRKVAGKFSFWCSYSPVVTVCDEFWDFVCY